jgi:hypothetical protein
VKTGAPPLGGEAVGNALQEPPGTPVLGWRTKRPNELKQTSVGPFTNTVVDADVVVALKIPDFTKSAVLALSLVRKGMTLIDQYMPLTAAVTPA